MRNELLPQGMRIELARRADAAVIAGLSRELIEAGLGWSWRPARVLRALDNPEATVIKLAAGPALAGFAIMRFGSEEAHLDLLAVRPEFRRVGNGAALVRWLEASALTAGVSIVRLELRRSNVAARRFYSRLGYSPCRIVRGYYQGREDAVQMARDLWCDLPINAT
jgi:ribosomal-protein-alanine N-acetyltransferase